MKKGLIIILLPFIIACTKKVDSRTAGKEENKKDCTVYLKSTFELQDKNLLRFIDEYIGLYQKIGLTEKSELNSNFYLIYIYQNDFFTRVKISFIPPYAEFLKHACKGTGFFEYKGRVFIIVTGLEGLCVRDSSLVKELMIRYKDRIKPEGGPTDPFTFTCEADIVGDTVFIRHGTMSPMSAPPSDTAVLYTYMRSIKSYSRFQKD